MPVKMADTTHLGPPTATTEAPVKEVKRRRTHTKSRHGCNRCKRYRYKCPEEPGGCSRCAEKHVECVYANPSKAVKPTPTQSHSNTPEHGISREPSYERSTPSSPGMGHFIVQDMQLLKTFITKTAFALSEHKEVGRMMSTYGIGLALEPGHVYLLHQVLCVTALHAATLEESITSLAFTSLIEAAHHHSAVSMASFRHNVTSIGSHNALHVFLYTAFISIAIWARTNPKLRRYNEDLNDGFMRLTSSQWMRTARGTTSLLGVESGKSVGAWIIGSPLEILLPFKGHFDPPILAQDLWAQAYQQRLTGLSSLFSGRDDRVSEACLPAIKFLDECLRQTAFTSELLRDPGFRHPDVDIESLQLNPRPTSMSMSWIFRVVPDFLDLLDEGSSEAILVLAHYGVLMHRVPEIWTTCGYGKALVAACDRHFLQKGDEAWLAWMSWPSEAIRQLDEERPGIAMES